MGTTWPVKRPSSMARAARRCDYQCQGIEALPGQAPALGHHLGRQSLGTRAYRLTILGPNGKPGPCCMVEPIGTRVIDSTPPAITMS